VRPLADALTSERHEMHVIKIENLVVISTRRNYLFLAIVGLPPLDYHRFLLLIALACDV
jgi:hypothetical protein